MDAKSLETNSTNYVLDELTLPATNPHSPRPMRFLVVDDDPSFGKIFQKIAKQSNISVIRCVSLSAPEILSGQRFDAAIVDYDLGMKENGCELAKKLEQVLGNIPIFLISQTDRRPETGLRWPHCIHGFLNKNVGHQALFDAIHSQYSCWRIKRGFSSRR